MFEIPDVVLLLLKSPEGAAALEILLPLLREMAQFIAGVTHEDEKPFEALPLEIRQALRLERMHYRAMHHGH